MPNFTVALPDDLLTDAKVAAAKTGTSVNSIIRVLLDGFVKNQRSALSGNYEILLKYSLGQVSPARAVALLHLENGQALNNLAIQAGLPLPRLSPQEEEAMQKRFGEMLDRAESPS